MDGFLNINKPLGVTSSDIVVHVRRLLPKGTRVGHGGTLDPDASGVLPVCIGGAARLFDYIIDKEKTYIATLALGKVTDTQDAGGKVIAENPVTVGPDDIEKALPDFIGDIEQIPPMYSAIKKDGKRLYQLARKGEIIEVPARTCHIESIELTGDLGGNKYAIRVCCGKGVYIRTLCHDIGARLGCGGHMSALVRSAAGAFSIENAVTIEEIDALCACGKLESMLLPMDFPLGKLPRVDVGIEHTHAVKNGNPLRAEWLMGSVTANPTRIYLDGKFCGIGEIDSAGLMRFKAMLLQQ